MFPCLGESVVMIFGVGSVQTESRHLEAFCVWQHEWRNVRIYLCVCAGYQCGPIRMLDAGWCLGVCIAIFEVWVLQCKRNRRLEACLGSVKTLL